MSERINSNEKIASLELQIKLMEESLLALKIKHDQNIKLINDLIVPKVGTKRQRWQVI